MHVLLVRGDLEREDPEAGLMKAPDVLAVLALSGLFDYVALLTAGGPR
jgi:hypothetical protein